MRVSFIRRRVISGSEVDVKVRVDFVRGLISIGTLQRCRRVNRICLSLGFGIFSLAPVGGSGPSPPVLGVADGEFEPARLKAEEGMSQLRGEQGGLGPLHGMQAVPEVLDGRNALIIFASPGPGRLNEVVGDGEDLYSGSQLRSVESASPNKRPSSMWV